MTSNHRSLLTLIAFNLAALASAHAGSGHGPGNGGGGEPLFHAITVSTGQWLEKGLSSGKLAEKLKLGSQVSPADLVRKFNDAVAQTHVEFIPAAKLKTECRKNRNVLACELMRTSRICMNMREPVPHIVCHQELFDQRSGDVQYVIAFHEYLGIAGVETNDEQNYSKYPISRHLLKFANPRQVIRWELADDERNENARGDRCRLGLGSAHSTVSEQTVENLRLKGYSIVDPAAADLGVRMEYRQMETYRETMGGVTHEQLDQQYWCFLVEKSTGRVLRCGDYGAWELRKQAHRAHVLQEATTPEQWNERERYLQRFGYGEKSSILDAALSQLPSCHELLF